LRELELGDALIPLKALQVAEELSREQAYGQDPDVIVLGEEITAQDAANTLGVSRTHLVVVLLGVPGLGLVGARARRAG
jgi:hypothetical protein